MQNPKYTVQSLWIVVFLGASQINLKFKSHNAKSKVQSPPSKVPKSNVRNSISKVHSPKSKVWRSKSWVRTLEKFYPILFFASHTVKIAARATGLQTLPSFGLQLNRNKVRLGLVGAPQHGLPRFIKGSSSFHRGTSEVSQRSPRFAKGPYATEAPASFHQGTHAHANVVSLHDATNAVPPRLAL